MIRMRNTGKGLGIGILVWLLCSVGAWANGVPVRLFLNYVPDTSNWGPQTATGEAVVGVGDGFAQLSVHGLPVLTDERYTVWLVPVEGDEWVRMGAFNVDESGAADVGWSPDVFPYQAYSLIVVTVEPNPPAGDAPGQQIAIVGHFPNAAAEPVPTTQVAEGRPERLPVTGGDAPSRGLSLWGMLLAGLSMLLWGGVGFGNWWTKRQRRKGNR